MRNALIFLAVMFVFFSGVTWSQAGGWELYDDFDAYDDLDDMLDSGKWNISPSDRAIADFSIENGMLKIVHLTSNPNDSVWAQLVKGTRKIKGIKVKVLITKWEEEARARIGAEVGDLEENSAYRVWYAMELRNRWNDYESDYVGSVVGYASVEEPDAGWDWKYDIFYTNLGYNKQPIVGVSHTLIAMFEKDGIQYNVRKPTSYGRVEYEFTEEIIDTINKPFRGIGTRTSSAGGTCTVYFDKVKVYR
jgi:hypothetical protein